jgi:aldose 1-epimerase
MSLFPGSESSLVRRNPAARLARQLVFGILALGVARCVLAEVKVSHFGKTADGKEVQAFTITNKNGVVVKLLSRGATLAEWHVPDKNGEMADCVFGFDDVAGYESKGNGYFGATIGRMGNRIAGGKFKLDGKEYTLAKNDGPNTLHGGGKRSFDKVIWNGQPFEKGNAQGVVFKYVSPDGEEGFPGKLTTRVTFTSIYRARARRRSSTTSSCWRPITIRPSTKR